MSKLRVKEIAHSNGTVAATVEATGVLTASTGYGVSTGMVKLADAEWTSDTDGVNFDVFDNTKYINYKIFWWVCHESVAGEATTTSWYQTGMCFRDSNGNLDGAGVYDNNTSWVPSGSTDPTTNSSQSGAQNRIWMAGNGNQYDSQGEALISIPPDPSFRACVRGISQLVGVPRYSASGVNASYCEEFSSVLITGSNTNPAQLTGFRFCSFRGTTGNYSKRGYISVYGIEK
ncbi:MAG: hypothetical protein CMO44_10970 [Verrucomicrobiales bacterium]|nr:hypothetical protein [Verrucomicrobiales bacterium]